MKHHHNFPPSVEAWRNTAQPLSAPPSRKRIALEVAIAGIGGAILALAVIGMML